MLVIVGLSLAVSAGAAFVRQVPWAPDLKARDEFRATAGVTLDELLRLIDEGAIVVDTRPASAFEEEHLAAPQTVVLNVPADEFDLHLPRLLEFEGARFVLYCSSDACDFSEEVYLAMVDAGFDPADLHIYFPGWEGITEAGSATAAGWELSANDETVE
ncbi:MAG: rhodanese-like domain-containing protein [Planctomycetes bacterium]|nr:rhodanese-like domain-containing protein [Planctomycetota bacterium]